MPMDPDERKLSASFWADEVNDLAKSAHEEHFPQRRGLWQLTSDDEEGDGGEVVAVCYFNNNPTRVIRRA